VAWQWFHRLGSPRWFYEKTSPWMPWLATVAVVLLVIGSVWGLAFAPEESRQGNSYRIIYLHLPVAFLSMAGYFIMAIAGGIGLIWRMKLAFVVMKAAAPIGAVFTVVTLATGSIWGKPTWGTWWEWDARNTFMLVLLFLYLGIVALQNAFRQQDGADKACAILALAGTVNIPIIYKSVDWWYSLHQGATIKIVGESSIDASMAWPLALMILAFYVFYAWALLLHTRTELLQRERKTQWVRALATGSGH
jgi:heme exporter protein C